MSPPVWQSVYFSFVETFQRDKRPLHGNIQPPEPYSPEPGFLVCLPHVFLLFRRLRLFAGIPPRRRQVETCPAQSVFTARANGRPIIDRAVTFPANVPPGTSSAFDLRLDCLPVVVHYLRPFLFCHSCSRWQALASRRSWYKVPHIRQGNNRKAACFCL